MIFSYECSQRKDGPEPGTKNYNQGLYSKRFNNLPPLIFPKSHSKRFRPILYGSD
jgi:hypothetical protein